MKKTQFITTTKALLSIILVFVLFLQFVYCSLQFGINKAGATEVDITTNDQDTTVGVNINDQDGTVDINTNDQDGAVSVNVNDQDGTASVAVISNSGLLSKIKGYIVLRVEANGEAYYTNPKTMSSNYLGRPKDAFNIMREQGIGISNKDLSRIPIGYSGVFGSDDDGDLLSDDLEEAIGSDNSKKDTDGDGYNDYNEVIAGFDPIQGGGAKPAWDQNFINLQKGGIFLQVERNGEAWYVYPKDGKRYFLSRPEAAYGIMRQLGLGISENDFNKKN